MRKSAKTLLWLAVSAMAAVTLLQWAYAFGGKEKKADAGEMLLEVSQFQVELLASHAAEAARAASTGDLDGLKQSAYSVEYTHKRLRAALGGDLPELAGVTALFEWIVRLQIGGERLLKPEESERLLRMAPHFAELHEAYALLGSGSDTAAKERLKQADEKIYRIASEQTR